MRRTQPFRARKWRETWLTPCDKGKCAINCTGHWTAVAERGKKGLLCKARKTWNRTLVLKARLLYDRYQAWEKHAVAAKSSHQARVTQSAKHRLACGRCEVREKRLLRLSAYNLEHKVISVFSFCCRKKFPSFLLEQKSASLMRGWC